MQFAATHPLNKIRRVQIHNNIKRYRETELDKILQETGGSFVFGGPIFLSDLSACCHLKGDGGGCTARRTTTCGAWHGGRRAGLCHGVAALRRTTMWSAWPSSSWRGAAGGAPLSAGHGRQAARQAIGTKEGAVCLSRHPDALHPGGAAGRAGGPPAGTAGDAGRRRGPCATGTGRAMALFVTRTG